MSGNEAQGRVTLESLKNYSDRCNSEYLRLNSLAKSLYSEFEGLVEYISHRVTEEERDQIIDTHDKLKEKFVSNNKLIGDYTQELNSNLNSFIEKLHSGEQDQSLFENVGKYYQMLTGTSAETAQIFTNEIAQFYGSLAKAVGKLEQITSIMSDYANLLIGVYIPDEMKQPQEQQQPQQAAT